MKRARDIRDQLEGLLERVEIESTSSLNDLEAIKKSITAGSSANALFSFSSIVFMACALFKMIF